MQKTRVTRSTKPLPADPLPRITDKEILDEFKLAYCAVFNSVYAQEPSLKLIEKNMPVLERCLQYQPALLSIELNFTKGSKQQSDTSNKGDVLQTLLDCLYIPFDERIGERLVGILKDHCISQHTSILSAITANNKLNKGGKVHWSMIFDLFVEVANFKYLEQEYLKDSDSEQLSEDIEEFMSRHVGHFFGVETISEINGTTCKMLHESDAFKSAFNFSSPFRKQSCKHLLIIRLLIGAPLSQHMVALLGSGAAQGGNSRLSFSLKSFILNFANNMVIIIE